MPKLDLGDLRLTRTDGKVVVEIYTQHPLYRDWDFLGELCETEEEIQSTIAFLQRALKTAQKPKIEYNVCENCLAADGRAGTLVSGENTGGKSFCTNCYDTVRSGTFTIHAHLSRKPEELERTANLLSPEEK